MGRSGGTGCGADRPPKRRPLRVSVHARREEPLIAVRPGSGYFGGFEKAQTYLAWWRDEVANVRVHGTTQRRPADLFAEERAHLKPLPDEAYVVCCFGKYKVRKDCHIAIEGNHYSVPYVRPTSVVHTSGTRRQGRTQQVTQPRAKASTY